MGRSILVTDSGLIARIDSRAVARRGLSFSLVPFFQSVVYTLLRSLDVGKSKTFQIEGDLQVLQKLCLPLGL